MLRDVVKSWTPAPLIQARRKVLDWFRGPLVVWPPSGSSDRAGLIYDVGLCDGGDTEFYLAKGFRVVAIEANPALVKSARERFTRQIRAGWLTIVETAIGPSTGRVAFDVHMSNPHWSSIVSDRRERMNDAIQTIEVDCTTLDHVLRQYGIPYYLKIDIEDSDLDAIKSLKSLSALPPYLSAEAHSREIAQTLFDLGYRYFQLVDQREKMNFASGHGHGGRGAMFGSGSTIVIPAHSAGRYPAAGSPSTRCWPALTLSVVRRRYSVVIPRGTISMQRFDANPSELRVSTPCDPPETMAKQ